MRSLKYSVNSYIRADDRDQGVILGVESALKYGTMSLEMRSENLSPEQQAFEIYWYDGES